MHIPLGKPDAIARVSGNELAPDLFGTVRFYSLQNRVFVVADLSGLPSNDSGFYGFHIHEGQKCAGERFADTGSHFSVAERPHPEHAGDLPPLMYCDGRACMAVVTNRFAVQDVVGRTVVIHTKADDFSTQPAGNAGQKMSCGEILSR